MVKRRSHPVTCHAETVLEMVSACRGLQNVNVQDGRFDFPGDNSSVVCWGAFVAIQSLSVMQWPNGAMLLGACPPANSTRLELIKVFLKYAAGHPEKLHEPFGNGLVTALVTAYPCSGH